MIAEAGEGFAHMYKGRIRQVKLGHDIVCAAPIYVQMACRLLGISNRGTMHGIRYPGQVLKGEGEGG